MYLGQKYTNFFESYKKIAQKWYKNMRFGRFSIEFHPNVWFYGYIWAKCFGFSFYNHL